MSTTAPAIVILREFAKSLRQHHRLFLLPVLVCSALAVVAVFTRSATWTASQALLVRDEAAGQQARPGRFDDSESMKTAQETIQEVARNHEVVAAALRAVGPPANYRHRDKWPTRDDVDQIIDAIGVNAPRGAEFGRTEVIYLSVKSNQRERAVALTAAVCDQLESRLQQVRNARAVSMFDELARSLDLAQTDLDEATTRLESMERDIGSDLGELRALNDSSAGDSSLLSALNQIKNELRQSQADWDANEQLKRLLISAQEDPDRLLAASGRLLASQPGLRRLREGLVDSQLKTAELAGTMSQHHPRVRAAREAEREVRDDLHAELAVALRGVQAELDLGTKRIASLDDQAQSIEGRLHDLAGLRARYQNLVDDVQQRAKIADKCKQDLAETRASGASARTASLISRLDKPLASSRPLGPSNAMILLVGAAGGLLTGIGLVFLVTPFSYTQQRRWSDFLPFGRRATDRVSGRRTTDAQQPDEKVNYGRRAEDVPNRATTPTSAPAEGPAPAIQGSRSSLVQCLTKLDQRQA